MLRLCAPDELAEGQSRGFSLQDLQLLAVRRHDRVYLYRNRCPHRGVSLDWHANQFLDDSRSLLRCAQHGALFLIETGECVTGPCAGDYLQALPCREDRDGIWLLDVPAEDR
ncbi:Rieske (2Fe-2S) protein [Zestomonas thermotolerans]|jgi:nitrite reductase/ring-hydroxylating ferredoxin subunit|uniref:Rieske (2Fe-2S) protein n=1 Tax=Zestomonas thermotolerans TaxID=157784 RepID=UPI00036D93D4|nr:Rieske 2Fe-2S domain-containing protein [Pseudomonas thermotolerans]MBO2510757.1 MFS transporter [Gammaproteobacteria bacterium]